MKRSILATATLAALVALSACSSNDDDGDAPGTDTDTGTNTDADAGSGAGDTSELAGDREVSSTPGGDTSAIAGYWDAPFGAEPASGERFVVITDDGLQTSYERQFEDEGDMAACYSPAGPQTLTPNGDDVYTPADGSSAFTATRSADDATLTVTLQPDIVQTWTLVEDGSPEDLALCSDTEEELAVAGDEATLPGELDPGEPDQVDPGGSSMFNPDAEPAPPRTEPSGDDSSAIEGLWDATGGPEGRVDERYVLISDDGLWTVYDYRQDDLASEGNCYEIMPRALDLETGEGRSGTYSVSDGPTVTAIDTGDADTLTLTNDGEPYAEWPRVTGESADDLEACAA